MTEQQAKQIREMREQGIGYRSIALTVGLSRDIVRNFCKSRGLSGYGSALTKNIREQVMLGKACLYCGKEMKQPDTGRPKKFCLDKCSRISHHMDNLRQSCVFSHSGRLTSQKTGLVYRRARYTISLFFINRNTFAGKR